MERPLPRTPAAWFEEIQDAIADTRKIGFFWKLLGHRVKNVDLFHHAPLVCLKFRGRKLRGPEAKRVTETALANYVANTSRKEFDHRLERKPILAFALCYVAAHLTLDLLNEQDAEAILNYCEKHLEET